MGAMAKGSGQKAVRELPGRLARHIFFLGLFIPEVVAFGWGTWSSPATKKYATDELDDTTFNTFVEENSVTAILFYAPWCYYSQQMMPAWDLAAQKLKLHDPPVPLAKIDSHRYGSVGDKYGVNAFPTLKLFIDGAVFDYDSHQGRGWQQIVKWVNRHIDRDHTLKSVEDADHYLHDNDLNVVGLFPDGYNSSIFVHSARHFEDVMFAESQGTEISKQIADHLSKHATLVCETIDIGQSHNNTKEGVLPRPGMHCSDAPRNPQRPEWTDRFSATVSGEKVVVHRNDSTDGWQQLLQLKCCDDEKTTEAKDRYHIPVPSLVMFMPHDERFAIFDGNINDIHAIDKWISARRTPMVMRMSPETAEKILGTGTEKTPVLFLISRDEQPQLEKTLREAVRKLRGRVLVCFSGLSSPIEKRLAEVAGIDEGGPVITMIETHSGTGQFHTARKFRLPTQGVTPEAVSEFISDYEKGTLKPWLRSEPEPTAEDMDAVGVLVGTSFTAVARDESKDVLVDFYAPWCGHCRKFEPSYKALAQKLKHVKSLKIMKLDATRNEVEGMSIMGFPTIILFPGGKQKNEVTYQGSRQPDDISRWLQEHCTFKFDPHPPAGEVQEDPVESGLLDPSEEDL